MPLTNKQLIEVRIFGAEIAQNASAVLALSVARVKGSPRDSFEECVDRDFRHLATALGYSVTLDQSSHVDTFEVAASKSEAA